MTQPKLLYLTREDTEKSGVTMPEVIAAVEAMYLDKGHGRVEMPPLVGIHTRPNAWAHAMPGYIPSSGAAGMKWIAGYPENLRRGLPQVSGLIILMDDETGLPYCIMDCRWVTAMRTGAKTALAARLFARPDSRAVGIVACGIQGRSNLTALACVLKIEQVKAYDINRQAAGRYAAEMSQALGMSIQVVGSAEEAVREMDIVVTSGPLLKDPQPVIEDDWFKPGAFGAPIDFDAYWKPEVFASADIVSIDDRGQFLHYKEMGYFKQFPPRHDICELGEVAAGKAPRRENHRQRIIAMNLGLALDDMATAPLIYRAAKSKGLGTWLDL